MQKLHVEETPDSTVCQFVLASLMIGRWTSAAGAF